jgi:hypothetical protein
LCVRGWVDGEDASNGQGCGYTGMLHGINIL